MKDSNVYKRIAIDLVLALIIICLLLFLAPKLIAFFLPFVIGYIIALIANPLVKLLEKRLKIVRKHGSAIVIVVVLAIVIGLLYLIISLLVKETISFVGDLPNLYDALNVQIKVAQRNLQGIYNAFPKGMKQFVDNFGDNLGDYMSKFIQNIELPSISDASLFVKNAAEFFFMFLITIMSAYFFIAEREKLSTKYKNILPDFWQEKMKLIADNFKLAFGGYFKAQFKIMFVITFILFIGFEILGVGYAVLIAIGTAFVDFLPVFGTGTIIWPWALVDLVTGNYLRAVALLIIYLVCQVVRNILQPKLVGDSIGISPLATLVFLYIGYKVKGLLGIIIGIPIGMVLVNLYNAGAFNSIVEDVVYIANDISNLRKKDDRKESKFEKENTSLQKNMQQKK